MRRIGSVRSDRAFTLIELIVSIVILSILSATAVTGYNYFVQKSSEAAAIASAENIVKRYHVQSVATQQAIDINSFGDDFNFVYAWDGVGTGAAIENYAIAKSRGLIAELRTAGVVEVFLYLATGNDSIVHKGTDFFTPGNVILIVEARVGERCYSNLGPQGRAVGQQGEQVRCPVPDGILLIGPGVADTDSGPDPATTFVCHTKEDGTEETLNVEQELADAYIATGDVAGECVTPLEDQPNIPAVNVYEQTIFMSGSASFTNNFTLIGDGSGSASVYVGGDFACNSNTSIDGTIVTRGSASLTNSCAVHGVWAGGDVSTSTAGVTVVGDIVSSGGDFIVGNSGISVDDIWVNGVLNISDGGTITRDMLIENATDIPVPPVVDLPVYRYNASDWAGWQISDWSEYTRGQAQANGAPSWAWRANRDMCNISGANYSLSGKWDSPSVPTVMDARGCRTLDFNGSAGTLNINLYADLTIIVEDFSHTGTMNVRSSDGNNYEIRFVSPYTSGSDTCGKTAGGSIKFSAGGVFVEPSVSMLLYAPDSVVLTNGMNFSGQVYGCSMNLANDVTLAYKQVGLPGWN